MEQAAIHSSPTVAYIIKCFPRLSETFILHEVLELERQGLSLRIFSLLRSDGKMHAVAEEVRAQVTYLPTSFPAGLLLLLQALLRRFRKEPGKLVAVAGAAIRRFWHPNLLKTLLYAIYIAEQLETEGIMHLHAHYANTPAWVALLIKQLTGIPFSFTAHAKDIYLSQKPHLAYKIQEARFVVTCTAYNHRYLSKLVEHSAQPPLHCIYHGLNLRAFPEPDVGTAQPMEPPLILTVARLVEKKGLHYLLEACYLLKEKGIRFRCHIVGAGPLRSLLEKVTANLSLSDQVTFCGAQTHDQVIAELHQASIKVLPCVISENGDRDGIPNVLVEAMYTGVPVISTTVSGIPELITTEVNGLLVAPRESGALATAIARLLQDETLRLSLARAGHQTVLERFSMEQNVRQLRALFKEAAAPVSSQAVPLLSDLSRCDGLRKPVER